MLKYTDAQVTFAEVPDEITLCINISNCPCHCEGCHSAYLAEDIGYNLGLSELRRLLILNKGITCVSFMGGDSEPSMINKLAKWVKEESYTIKVAWYSGRQELSKYIDLNNFDYIKLGPYIKEYGPLNYNTTNQKFYSIVHTSTGKSIMYDNTWKFWKNEIKD